ncbi:MAG: hypothetical protein HYY84_01980 [Deltaproteobacteria bacterium]|nr:hypothetical protein [Deltaproteobacteria bacterium]
MKNAVASSVVVALLIVWGACDKKQSTPPPQTGSDAGGGTDGGTDGGVTDAGVAQDAGQDAGGTYCIRQNCSGDSDCVGVGPDGGNYNCLTLPTGGNICQRVCGDGGVCTNGQVCRNGRCGEADCQVGNCGVVGIECRALPTPTSLCLPPCATPEDCCSSDDPGCLANLDCVNNRCTPKQCASQSDCDSADAGLSCVSYASDFPTMTCASSCSDTAQCAAAAAQANQTDKFVCQ